MGVGPQWFTLLDRTFWDFKACHAFRVANQRTPSTCGRLHVATGEGAPVVRGVTGLGLARCGSRSAAADDSVQQGASFHVKHHAVAPAAQRDDTPPRMNLGAFME